MLSEMDALSEIFFLSLCHGDKENLQDYNPWFRILERLWNKKVNAYWAKTWQKREENQENKDKGNNRMLFVQPVTLFAALNMLKLCQSQKNRGKKVLQNSIFQHSGWILLDFVSCIYSQHFYFFPSG